MDALKCESYRMTDSTDISSPSDGTPGPFEVAAEGDQPTTLEQAPGLHQNAQQLSPVLHGLGKPASFNNPEREQSDTELERRIDCSNYSQCLNLAAALNWHSFTCNGCTGEINEALRWRAAQSTKRDALAQAICGRVTLGK